MRKEIIDILSQKEPPTELAELKQRCEGLVSLSRNVMKTFYAQWDRNDRVYRGERNVDEADVKALKRDEPAKVYVPLTHAQVQTFVSFLVMMLTQRYYFYELSGTGVEDEKPAKLGQAVLQRDLEYNKFQGILLPQFGTDVAVKGLGIFKTDWVRETSPTQTTVPDPKWQPDPAMPQVTAAPMVTRYVDKTKYLGNRITCVSPYRWFPDTRLPITRYRDGEFCADENEYSKGQLEKLQREGNCAGIEYIPKIQDIAFTDRRFNVMDRQGGNGIDPGIPGLSAKDADRYALVTEVELRCNPARTFISKGVAINPDLDAEVVVLIWIANDQRIIRIEDSGYDHNEFLYDAAQFFNDQSRVVNFGIAELLGPMQDIMDWLLNSRVTNVRKTVYNQAVVDPRYIDMNDIKDRNPIVRTKATPDGLSIDSYYKQIVTQDVTTGHLTDMSVIKSFSETATGLTETLQGEAVSGRRSAREMGNVISSASSRAILPIKGLWQGALLPLGRKMLSNHRQGLDMQQLVSIVGIQKVVSDPGAAQSFLPVDKTSLTGSYDFNVFDATLPSQRMAQAMALAQAGETIQKGGLPAVMILGKDPKLLFDEWLELMGIKNANRFDISQERLGMFMQMAGAGGNQGSPQNAQGQGRPSGANG
jgi:hypothetical protein